AGRPVQLDVLSALRPLRSPALGDRLDVRGCTRPAVRAGRPLRVLERRAQRPPARRQDAAMEQDQGGFVSSPLGGREVREVPAARGVTETFQTLEKTYRDHDRVVILT